MPLVHSFAPETTQCRGCPDAAAAAATINPDFHTFESFGGVGREEEAGDVIFPPPTDEAFAEKHADVERREGMVEDAAADGNHRASIGPMPDIVSIASNNAPSSAAEGSQVQPQTPSAAGEQQLRHDDNLRLHQHYGTNDNEYHNTYGTHQGLPGMVGDQYGKEAHHSILSREKGDIENKGKKFWAFGGDTR